MPTSVSARSTLSHSAAAAIDAPPAGLRIAFVQASWHQAIVHRARDGFVEEMQRLAVDAQAIEIIDVAGAFELPLMAKRLAQSGRYDAVVACALVVDGGIYRHDFVAGAVLQGLMAVQLETGVPVLSVVLTPHQFQPHQEHQAFFGSHFVIKGAEAAAACMQTVQGLRRQTHPAGV